MSTKLFRPWRCYFALAIGVAALGAGAAGTVEAQQANITMRVVPDSARLLIQGTCTSTSVWSFRDSYAGMLGLGNRISQFVLFDEAGNEIPSRKIAPGQFESTEAATRFQYEVNLAPPIMPTDSAMVSWLTKERGIAVLADILPLLSSEGHPATAIVRFILPDGWRIYSNEQRKAQSEYEVSDAGRAVFALGAHLRTSQANESGLVFSLITDGDWAFADEEAIEMAGKILKAHREVFGAPPADHATLMLFPFPRTVGASQWTAETRGSTITLLMGRLPSKIGALAQLSTPLTHELFHLWVPNGLALEGNYDWFYEGFTVYQAARTAVRLDMLTFAEFLSSIARAYDSLTPQVDSLSLLEASRKRFTVGQSAVYSKAQIVAFIYDLRLLNSSGGKRSLSDAYRKLFQERGARAAAASKKADANEAVMKVLATAAGSEEFVRTFIGNPVSINLADQLAPFGLKVERLGLRSYISVNEKLSKQQRDLLRQLGYNDAVRGPRRVQKN